MTRNVVAISLWDSQKNADAYGSSVDGYPKALKVVDKVLDGAPKNRAFNVIHSTLHKIDALAGKNRSTRSAGYCDCGRTAGTLILLGGSEAGRLTKS